MKRSLWALGALLSTMTAMADEAWWQSCDHCSTETQFNSAAIQAPEPWEFVYVTNRQTNTTRLYSRFTTWEDLDGGMVRMTHVIEQPMSPALKAVFEQAVANARVSEALIPRDDLTGSGIGPVDSVLLDIRYGRVLNSLRGGLTVWLSRSGLIPTLSSVNGSIGLSNPRVGGISAGGGGSIRETPIRLSIQYPDGSTMDVTWFPDGTLRDWSATDVNGNPIDFNPDGTVAPVGPGFDGPGLEFGPGNGTDLSLALLDFLQDLERRQPIRECRAEDLPGGRYRFTCTRY